MKNTIKYLFLSLFALVLFSCNDIETPQNRTTKFTSETIYIGMPKDRVIQAYGEPFSRDSYNDEDYKRIDILYYKEIVDIGSFPHILTTTLYFNNNILAKINQESQRI